VCSAQEGSVCGPNWSEENYSTFQRVCILIKLADAEAAVYAVREAAFLVKSAIFKKYNCKNQNKAVIQSNIQPELLIQRREKCTRL
jgi:hypothetical protein